MSCFEYSRIDDTGFKDRIFTSIFQMYNYYYTVGYLFQEMLTIPITKILMKRMYLCKSIVKGWF